MKTLTRIMVVLTLMLMGCKEKVINETPEDLVKSILMSNDLETYTENCSINQTNVQTVFNVVPETSLAKKLKRHLDSGELTGHIEDNWKDTVKDMARRGFTSAAVVEITYTSANNELTKRFVGKLHEDGKTKEFTLSKCVKLPGVGWRTYDDLSL